MKPVLILILFVAVFTQSIAQTTGTIRGKVIDADTRRPLWGVNIFTDGTEPMQGSSSDSLGRFIIQNIPLGRVNIRTSYLGYEAQYLSNLLISAGKELYIEIPIKESISSLNVVTIRDDTTEPINTMSTVSARQFTVEESQRYAAGFNDLSRMTQVFAGVASYNGEGNEIVIRGNSPRSLLWKVEGIEVFNPNHFPRGDGSGGGGISVIKASLISNSDFFTGAFPAEYGNGLSGVFDLNLRKGNPNQREYTLQLGGLGFEASAEGPLSSAQNSSFLFNYRYSTLALFNLANINLAGDAIIPEFQDLMFNLHFDLKKGNTLSIFGLGGYSSAKRNAVKDSSLWLSSIDKFAESEAYSYGLVGIKHLYFLPNNKTYIKSILAWNLGGTYNRRDSLDNNYTSQNILKENFSNHSARLSILFNHKYNTRNISRWGSIWSSPFYFYKTENSLEIPSTINGLNGNGYSFMQQYFFQHNWQPNIKWSVNGGLHFLHFFVNQKFSLEPRLGLKYRLSEKMAISYGSGIHSRIDGLGLYLNEFLNNENIEAQHNRNVDFTRALHNVLGIDYNFSKYLRIKTEIYYQHLYNVPISENINSGFSMLNFTGGIVSETLNNNGKGENYGFEITIEKFLSNNFYYLATGSLFQSRYLASDAVWYNTFFNTNHILNVLGGKDFNLDNIGKNSLGINSRLVWMGGNRFTPINLEASIASGFEIRDDTQRFSDKTPDFIRWDAGMFFRRNASNLNWILSLDFQNLTNRTNVFTYIYDDDQQKIRQITALGFIPMVNFKVEF